METSTDGGGMYWTWRTVMSRKHQVIIEQSFTGIISDQFQNFNVEIF